VQSGFDDPQLPYAAWSGTVAGIAELRRFHELPDWRPIWLDWSYTDTSEDSTVNG
jgi:hypothetical protein